MDDETKSQLIALIAQDPDIAERFAQAKEEIADKTRKLIERVNEDLKGYEQEIADGTMKKQLLLERGNYLKEADDESHPFETFIPSEETPLLNFLYFSSRDGNYDVNLTVLREAKDIDTNLEDLRKQFDDEYGQLTDGYKDDESRANLPQAMEAFLYNNMNHETFKKIKKMKTLSLSPNPAEAELAKKKCQEFCLKYNLDYDRIPSYYES